MFSNEFSEAQIRNINEGYSSDALPYTESYDYLSDSDLEDDEPEQSGSDQDSGSEIPTKAPKYSVPGGSQDVDKVEIDHASASDLIRPSCLPSSHIPQTWQRLREDG